MPTGSKTEIHAKLTTPIGEAGIVQTLPSSPDNIIYYGDQVAIRVCDGTFWQVKRDDSDKIFALARHIQEWEIMQIVHPADPFIEKRNRPVRYNEMVAFHFLDNKSFVGAQLNSPNAELTARVPWVKEWETFVLVKHPKHKPKDNNARYGGWFALRAYNGKYVMFDRDNSKQLLAVVPHIDEWETFVFIPPGTT